jgi:ankyrin repeat protein
MIIAKLRKSLSVILSGLGAATTSMLKRTISTCFLFFLTTMVAFAQSSLTPLIEAIKAADLNTARQLLTSGVDVQETQGDGATALHWAVHRNNQDAVNLLLAAGIDVNVSNELGATALWLASINGDAGMIELLLTAGANPNLSLKRGETPLMTAARSGNVNAVLLLLENGADIDRAETEHGQTALMWATAQRHAGVVRILLDNGADLTARSKVWYQLENTAGNTNTSGNFRMAHGGSTPFMFAARSGDIATSQALLDAGANVNDTEASKASALVVAAHSGHEELALFLLKSGANPNLAAAGYAPIHAAVLRSQFELVEQLLEKGADINAKVEHGTSGRRFSADYSVRSQLIGMNAFWMAAKYGEVKIVQLLLDRGADPFFVSEAGVTTLQVAMGNSGSSLDHRRDRIGNAAPDLYAEEQRTLALAKILIDRGIDVNAADDRGQTAMHHAVLKNFPAVVQYLALRGADIAVVNGREQTPLVLAETVQTIPGTNGLRGTRPKVAEVLRGLGAVSVN